MRLSGWGGLACLASVSMSSSGLAAQPPDRPLLGQELLAIYQAKTWKWKDGAAYFAASREFRAVGQSGGAPTRAAGTWAINDQGLMCFAATWTDGKWRKWDRTCFEHRYKDGAVLQRRLPNGTWYVFRSNPEQESDEARKFTAGEQLTAAPSAR